HRQAGRDLVSPAPQVDGADAQQRTDRRGEGGGVVGGGDAPAEADGQAGDDQPAAPQPGGGPGAGLPGRPERDRQQGAQQDEGGGQQPGDLAAEAVVEQAGEPGDAPAPSAGGAHVGPDAADLVAVQPAEAVVAEDQVHDAVVLRAADVG